MSVLIKGIGIPRSCGRCWFNNSSLSCAVTGSCIDRDDENREKLDDCPLVDLGKHGDLIDRDEVIPKLKFINEAEHQIYGRESWGFTAKCIDAFDDAPTVIEAEDGTCTM